MNKPTRLNRGNLPTDALRPNDYNPNEMSAAKFKELVAEVKHVGRVPKPIVVRPDGDGYVIVDGEHAWRAAKQLGSTTVRAEVIGADDFESMRQTYKRNQHGTHNPLKLGAMFTRMMADRGLSRRALAKAIKVSEGTVRNAMLYSEAAKVRNTYAPGGGDAVLELSVRTLRRYLSLPPAIANIWLDDGGNEKQLERSIKNRGTYGLKSEMERVFKELGEVADLIGLADGLTFRKQIWRLGECFDVFEEWHFQSRKKLSPYVKVLSGYRFNYIHRLLASMFVPQDDGSVRFVLGVDELAALKQEDDDDTNYRIDLEDRVRDAVLAKTGEVPVDSSAKVEGIRDRLLVAEMEQEAPDWVKTSKATACWRYAVWKWDGDYCDEGKVSDEVKAAHLAGLEEGYEGHRVKHELEQAKRNLHAKEKLDAATPLEIAVDIARVILGDAEEKPSDETEAFAIKLTECIEHRWLVAMHDSVEMFAKSKRRHAEMLAAFAGTRP